MGKRSVKEKYLKSQKLKYQRFTSQLKPPFNCPVCFREKTVKVKRKLVGRIKKTTDGHEHYIQEYHFLLVCSHGCFKTVVIFRSDIFSYIDAYVQVADGYRLKQKCLNKEVCVYYFDKKFYCPRDCQLKIIPTIK